MTKQTKDLVKRLQKISLVLSQTFEQAEAHVAEIPTLLSALASSPPYDRVAIFGAIVLEEPYFPWREPNRGPGNVYQGALLLPQGLGIAVWNRDEYLAVDREPELLGQANIHFVPFAVCNRPVKGLLLAQIRPLFEEFYAGLRAAQEF